MEVYWKFSCDILISTEELVSIYSTVELRARNIGVQQTCGTNRKTIYWNQLETSLIIEVFQKLSITSAFYTVKSVCLCWIAAFPSSVLRLDCITPEVYFIQMWEGACVGKDKYGFCCLLVHCINSSISTAQNSSFSEEDLHSFINTS